jgi:hypothetical protein
LNDQRAAALTDLRRVFDDTFRPQVLAKLAEHPGMDPKLIEWCTACDIWIRDQEEQHRLGSAHPNTEDLEAILTLHGARWRANAERFEVLLLEAGFPL